MGKKYINLVKGKVVANKVVRVRKKCALVRMGEYLRERI